MERLKQFSEWVMTWQGIAWIAVAVMFAEFWGFWHMDRSRRRYNARLEIEARALENEFKAAALARANPINFKD